MKPVFYNSAEDAVADIEDGATIFVGGFGPIGYPINLMQALFDQSAGDLTFISNGGGSFGPRGPIDFLHFYGQGRVRKMINIGCGGSHPSRANALEKLILSGEVEGETVPQGSLAERIRAGAAGVPAFYTPVGVGTEIAEGKEYREFDGRGYILEHALRADYALVHAWKSDRHGNLQFRRTARNFNHIMAQAADISIAEIEEPIVPSGELDPDSIHTAGVFVNRVLPIPTGAEKRIDLRYWRNWMLDEAQKKAKKAAVEKATAEKAEQPEADALTVEAAKVRLNRDQSAAIAARELQPGWVVNLGIGMPAFVSNYIFTEMNVTLHAEHGLLGYGPVASEEEEDQDVTNATGDCVTLLPGAATMDHAESFAMIRQGMIDCVILGAYEVDQSGSFSNWKVTTALPVGVGNILGGAMDLAQCSKRVFIMMEHTLSDGVTPRIVEKCVLPITAENVVTKIITDIAVIDVTQEGLVLERHAPGFSAEDIQALTGVPLIISPNFSSAL